MGSLFLVLASFLAARATQEPRVGLAPDPTVQDDAPTPGSEHARNVSLSELRAFPARHLGAEVRFPLQFRGLSEDWKPFLSRFDPSRWIELEAWPDELFTWDEAVFAAPAGHLFVRRGGGFEPLVRRAHRYQRFEARARVREVFLGEPWLEIVALVPLEGEVGEGTVLCVSRARELVLKKQFDLALEQYERARAAPLPPHALAHLLVESRSVEELRDAYRAARRGKGGEQTP